MIWLVHYIKGFVRIKVWGYSTERFLNLCGNHNIFLWDVDNHGDYVTMSISVKAFFEIKPLLKKTGTKAAIIKKYGLPFFVEKMKKRKIFVAGFLLCFFFWIAMSFFIWNIKIEGNYTITDDVLLDYLKGRGVHISMRRADLNLEELEKGLREDFDLITWTSAQRDGTTLTIYIKENEMQNENTTNGEEKTTAYGTDLYATKNGVVTFIVTRNGVPCVKTGDSVNCGDILVSGAIPIYNDDQTVRCYRYAEADADIWIRYEKKYSIEKNIEYVEKTYTGCEKEGYFFGIKDREWNFRLGKIKYALYDVEKESHPVRLLEKWYLPIRFGKEIFREYENIDSVHTKDEMTGIMKEEWLKLNRTLEEKGVHIIEKNVTIKKDDKKWVLCAKLLLEEAAYKAKDCQTIQISDLPNEDNNGVQ